MEKSGWGRAIAGGFVVLFLAYGPRAAMPTLLPSYLMAVDIEREAFGTMLTVQSIVWALSGLALGWLADRGGLRPVLLLSALLYALGLTVLALSTSLTGVLLGGGLLAGIGLGGTSFATLFATQNGAFTRSERRAGLALIATGAAVAPLLLIPAIQALIVVAGARTTLLALAGLVLLIVPFTALIPQHPVETTPRQQGTMRWPRPLLLLLLSGALASGFHTGLISAYLGVVLADSGLDVGVTVMTLFTLSLFTGIGLLVTAMARGSALAALGVLFALRAAAAALLITAPLTQASALVVAALAGLSGLAALPLAVEAVTHQSDDRRHGFTTGLLFLFWQVGSMAAIAFGYDTYGWWGDYHRGWQLCLALGVLMATLHFLTARRFHQPA